VYEKKGGTRAVPVVGIRGFPSPWQSLFVAVALPVWPRSDLDCLNRTCFRPWALLRALELLHCQLGVVFRCVCEGPQSDLAGLVPA